MRVEIYPSLVPPQKKGSSCKRWRNISHSKGKESKEEQRQDQDKVAAEEERKQRGLGGSFRGWNDCTETGGTVGLGGGDWSGFQQSQEAVGDLTVCDCYAAGRDVLPTLSC